MKDSLELLSNSPRPKNSGEIVNRYTDLKANLKGSQSTDDLVNFNLTTGKLTGAGKAVIPPQRESLSPAMQLIKKGIESSLTRVKSSDGLSTKGNWNNLISTITSNGKSTIPLRNNFQSCLGKLNDNSTKDVGFAELRQMINNNTNQDALRTFISALSVYYNNCTVAAREIQVILLGYIASVFRENLMDPLDKPPNIIKTINRILNLIHTYLKENSFVVHKACSHAVLEVYDYCMPKDDVNAICLIFVDPLISILTTGTNKFAQSGAATCLSDFIFHIGRDKYEASLKILSTFERKVTNLVVKSKTDNQYLFQSLINLMNILPFESFLSNLKEIYERLIFTIRQPKFFYQTKIECMKLFTLIARKLQSIADVAIGYFQEDVITALQDACKDRIHKVQLAAQETLKEWNELEAVYRELEKKKMQVNPEMEGVALSKENWTKGTEGAHKMDKLNFLRNLSKMSKNGEKKIEYDSILTQNMKEEIYKHGIGNVLKLSNFMKNKQQSTSPQMNKSPTKQVKQEISEYLRKSQQVKKYNNYDQMPSEMNEDFENKNEVKGNIIQEEGYSKKNEEVEREMTNKPQEPSVNLNLNEIKTNLKNLITFQLASAYNEFNSKVNSRLDNLENKINDAYIKVQDYKNSIFTSHSLKCCKQSQTDEYPNANVNGISARQKMEEKLSQEILMNIKQEIENAKIKENTNSNNNDSQITRTWKQTLKDLEKKNYNDAYANILNAGDDIYLLRLLCITGPALNSLSSEISKKVLMRVNMISRSYQIQTLLMSLIQISVESSIFSGLSRNDQNEILDTLYEYSGINSSLGSRAAELYTKLTSGI